MKRAIIFVIAAMMVAALGCGQRSSKKVEASSVETAMPEIAPEAQASDETNGVVSITMTTAAREVNFILVGTETATIDWGDGSEKETHEFEMVHILYGNIIAQRHYPDARPRTITITGENITGFQGENIQLTALDVSRNTALKTLACGGNQLTALDVSQNTALQELHCPENQLTALDVSQNAELTALHCWDNQLTALDVSANTALVTLFIAGNRFTAKALNNIFASLHDNANLETHVIDISNNPGSADCDPLPRLENKEWQVWGFAGINDVMQGDNNEEEAGGFSLGVVSFKTSKTWTVGNQIWSDVVMATGCKKEDFNGGVRESYYNCDCRENPGYGDLFSWQLVNDFKDKLCSDGWRVPTSKDFANLDKALGGTGESQFGPPAALIDKYLNAWGGAYGGSCNQQGRLDHQGTVARYYSQTERSKNGYLALTFYPDHVDPKSWDYKDYGLVVRCVKER